MLVWGDPSLYDSTIRNIEAIAAAGRQKVEYEVIPGISAVQVLAARHRITLNRVGRSVEITTGRRLAEGWPAGADSVVVMLDGEDTYLRYAGEDMEIFWGAYLGMPDEILLAGKLKDVAQEIHRRRSDARQAHGWIMDTYLLRKCGTDPRLSAGICFDAGRVSLGGMSMLVRVMAAAAALGAGWRAIWSAGAQGILQGAVAGGGGLPLGSAGGSATASTKVSRTARIPGAVVLIARNGKLVMFDAFGFRDREAKAPMQTDTIFRIASMTKPIVSVAAMMLAEEGKLSLAQPVSKYIPSFADTKVSVQKKSSDGTVEVGLEPQIQPMTVQDLMRHTSGLTYGFIGTNPVKQSYADMKVMAPDQTNAQMAEKLAKLALLYQPATRWEYSMSTDVLGRVVEVASGMPLDKFIEERISKPIKLGDTGFDVGPDKKDRGARPQKEGRRRVPQIPTSR